MAAFRATLEELEGADVVLHVIDITHRNAAEQAQVVNDMLAGLRLDDEARRILVLNKVDLLSDGEPEDGLLERLQAAVGGERVVLVSAEREWGLTGLLSATVDLLDYRRGRNGLTGRGLRRWRATVVLAAGPYLFVPASSAGQALSLRKGKRMDKCLIQPSLRRKPAIQRAWAGSTAASESGLTGLLSATVDLLDYRTGRNGLTGRI